MRFILGYRLNDMSEKVDAVKRVDDAVTAKN
jgi:hypothetical protein